MKRLGGDGLADNDLQVVSGENELENLPPKDRAKLEKKRGLIRAGMGAAADNVEDSGFEVAKANGAAMAMLGKRPKPSFGVDGLDVEDDREYGSDQVGGVVRTRQRVWLLLFDDKILSLLLLLLWFVGVAWRGR